MSPENIKKRDQIQAIEQSALHLLNVIESLGNSRETSLAKTKVQEAGFWAIASINIG